MADDLTVDGAALADFVIATDELPGPKHAQKIKLMDGTDNSTAMIPGDASNGLDVDVTRLPVFAAGSKVQLTDGTSDATVRNLAANDALNVAIVDGAGNQVTSFAGSGGTSSTDDADFTALSTAGTPIMGVRQDTPRTVTNDDMGIVKIDSAGRLDITVGGNTLDVAHDAVDAGLPVKVGGQARSSLPAAVSNADRSNMSTDLFGRLLTGQIDPGMQTWKQVEATTAQTGVAIWTPAAGKRIAVTSYQIGTGAATAGLLTIWWGASADTTYTQGTDQVLFRGSITPSASATPGVISNFTTPAFGVTADHVLRYTTVGNITVYITVYGYEF